MPARYLITGSSGFIGGHLVRALEEKGHKIVGLDLKDESGDVRIAGDVERLARGVDGIFHLAAIASVQASIDDPEGTFATNVTGTRHVFEAAKALDIPVVYASSAAIYGDNENLPLREDEPPKPLSPYAEHKLQNERDAASLGIKNFGVRFFNIYGPGQDPGSPYSGVISIFHDRLKAGKGLTIFGDGQQSRDFVYVGDAVRALMLAMEKASSSAPVANICSGKRSTLLELIEGLSGAMNITPAIAYEPARSGDIRHSLGNPGRFATLTGFTPEMPLAEGLRALAEGLVR